MYKFIIITHTIRNSNEIFYIIISQNKAHLVKNFRLLQCTITRESSFKISNLNSLSFHEFQNLFSLFGKYDNCNSLRLD